MNVGKSFTPLVSGAAAGLAVDLSLYPVDTIKTRLQSKSGFFKAGGFKSLYAGVGSVALGSTPGAAVFFTAYEATRKLLRKNFHTDSTTTRVIADMTAASLGEVMACLVRVPVEVVKQRAQVNTGHSSFGVFRICIRDEGFRGFYRGYTSTVCREIPFSVIQFPLWEFCKASVAKYNESREVTPWQSAWCGFFSGGISAAVTTPLDVAKTRIMLSHKQEAAARGAILPVLCNIWKEEGIRSLFAGIIPRSVLISFGGFIFLGMYDLVKTNIEKYR